MKSVTDAIKDFEREKKDFHNLKYSAAYINKQELMCDQCRLVHPPLKPNILEQAAWAEREKTLQEMKEFEKSLIKNIDQCLPKREIRPTKYKTKGEIAEDAKADAARKKAEEKE